MDKLTYHIIVFLMLIGSLENLNSQELISSENLSDQEFEDKLAKELSLMNSKDRFDYVVSWYYRLVRNNIDQLENLSKVFAKLAESDTDIALLQYTIGGRLFRTGEIDSAVIYLTSSSEVLREKSRFQLSSESYNELGNAYFTGGRFNMAVDSYLKSLRVGHESDDETAKFNAFLGLGRSYCAAGDTVIGVKLLNEYLRRSKQMKKMEASSDACGALAVIYQDIGDVQMSKYYYEKGLEYSSKSSSKSMQSNSLTNKAIIAFNDGSVDSAYLFFQKSLQLRLSLGSSRPIVDSYFNLASFKIFVQEYPSARCYIDTAMIYAERNGLKIEKMDLIELMIETYKLERNQFEVKKLEVKLDSLRRIQEDNSEIDPLSTGAVSVMLNNNETLPVDPRNDDKLWVYQMIAVLSLFIFSGGILYLSTRKF